MSVNSLKYWLCISNVLGWGREVLIYGKLGQGASNEADVYYFSPEGKKLVSSDLVNDRIGYGIKMVRICSSSYKSNKTKENIKSCSFIFILNATFKSCNLIVVALMYILRLYNYQILP